MPKIKTSGRWEHGGRHIKVSELLKALAVVRNQESIVSIALHDEPRVYYMLDFVERAGEFTITVGESARNLPNPIGVPRRRPPDA